ncbi:MAG: DUF4263 domain-containing protein [Deltaproteobacteria bacterium]|nr:DUF4263 domain-containing protein [Deltaproteobacteria bacterium]
MTKILSPNEIILKIRQWLMEDYWGPIYKQVKENIELINVVPGFLIAPQEIVFYLGPTHLAIEYVGPEVLNELPSGKGIMDGRFFDFSNEGGSFLNKIIGFDFSDGTIPLILPPFTVDLMIPTNAGFEKLRELKWNFAAQEMILGLNTGGLEVHKGQFTRIVNGRFFDADESGLRSRHIKWLDMAPLTYDDSHEKYDSFGIDLNAFLMLAKRDALAPYPIPSDFKFQKLPKINRFVELLGKRDIRETEITSFLADKEFLFILTMRFSAVDIQPERICKWQYGDRKPIKPDFFVIGPDGYADIVEFKLPDLKGPPIVGQPNRETFCAEITSYISQTRVYREYFDDPRNREWVQSKYGFKVYKPKRYLIIGRRWHFSSDEWREIASDHKDLFILPYDDLIDGVVVQFYQ